MLLWLGKYLKSITWCSEWNTSYDSTVQNVSYICLHKHMHTLMVIHGHFVTVEGVISELTLCSESCVCVFGSNTHIHSITHTWPPARHCVLILPGTCKSASLKEDCSLIPSVQHDPQWPSHTLTQHTVSQTAARISASAFYFTFSLLISFFCTWNSGSFKVSWCPTQYSIFTLHI